ncbi:MAG: YihY/virulence factor BrkB family protein [Prevotella sp.]|nr:YihY/virulence factor BrkB family protein [Prevotella sp.]
MLRWFRNTVDFLKDGIWHVQPGDVSRWRYILYSLIKRLLLSIELFTEKRLVASASALTYSTLLAIVPVFAVVFAIARGFGYSKYIEVWFRDVLSSQPQVAETIIGFVNSYLVHTKSGIFLGIGLLLMLWTVIMLLSNAEQAFNNIWQVKKQRSLYRTITDYMAMFLLTPFIIVLSSGISIFMTTFIEHIDEYIVLKPMLKFLIAAMPYLLMSLVFILLYVFMPNTKVKLSYAIVPGVLAGVAMQGLQFLYIDSQIWVSSYNAIYGSFAALPLFMLWLQISWTICLFGAELCYASQNLEDFAFRASTENLSHRYRLMLCMLLMSHICKRFDKGERAYTALELKFVTNIPIRIIHDLLYELTKVRLIVEVTSDEKGEDCVFMPAESISHLSVGTLIDRLESEGKWNFDVNVDTDNKQTWIKAIAARTDYLNKQRGILLKDL